MATDYIKARDILLDIVRQKETENIPLECSQGRILAKELSAQEDIPQFDKSPLDGYAINAKDSKTASKDNPVTLEIAEEIACGYTPTKKLSKGQAAKILTGAPIPEGADAVVMFEKTEFNADFVTVFEPVNSGSNIIYAGEDVKKGTLLAKKGMVIDAGLAGTLAAQGVFSPTVYKKPDIALISTGSELVEEGESISGGKIRNSNRYSLTAQLMKTGCNVKYMGTAKDSVEQIKNFILQGLEECDMVMLTGGVSVGDYDLTPAAMEEAGAEILVRGVRLKPGMACALGCKDGKLVCGLSGNPASSLTTYYGVVAPCVRKLSGYADFIPEEFEVEITENFTKTANVTRMLKGTLFIEDGIAKMKFPHGQGNVMISSSIGCNLMAIVPPDKGPLKAGDRLRAFFT